MTTSSETIAVAYVTPSDADQAKRIAKTWGFEYIGDQHAIKKRTDLPFLLRVNQQILELTKCDEPKLGAIAVDFISGAVNHRRKFGGGRGQDIAKAVGLKNGATPSVLDATAGLGRDAFVLASLGCKVTMLERMPVVAALLKDGLERALLNSEVSEICQQMSLLHASSISAITQQQQPDVIYLDPMYPHKEKSALVKKEMRVFQTLVGDDQDADLLLAPALEMAKYRVVVKRPSYAQPLANKKPSMSINMKKNRFDVYVNQAMPKGE